MKSISLFGLAMKGNNFDYKTLAELALKVGYIVDKNCSTKEVYDFLTSVKINTNSTFYKTWNDVVSKSRFELYIDQVLHYMSTYGTNYTGKAYIPNEDLLNEANVNFKNFKVIKSATKEEIIERCNGMLASGIALNQETIEDIFELFDKFYYLPDIEKIKNKEAKMVLCIQKGIVPKTTEEFLRFLVYLATKKTLLIKDSATVNAILGSGLDVSGKINLFGIEKLSEIFLRFKPLFLAFKKANKNNSKVINKLRKLAEKNHKAYEFVFFENILNDLTKAKDLLGNMKNLNNFKKVALIEAIRRKLAPLKVSNYVIRNGRTFVKGNENLTKLSNADILSLKQMESTLYKSLVDDIRAKNAGKVFYIPDYLDIKLPKSEKTFIGNLPFGTEIKLPANDLIVGIHWRGDEGTQDFDLSLLDESGYKIGWNFSYSNAGQTVIYSGDMTSANPEATELLYFARNDVTGMINVNRYNGEEGSLFTLFVAKESVGKNLIRNYMVKKENILFQTKLISDGTQQILGIKTKNSLIIQKVILSNRAVSSGNSVTNAYIDYSLNNQKNLLSLEKVLVDAGLIKVNKTKRDELGSEGKVVLDFSDVKKDDVISILSK